MGAAALGTFPSMSLEDLAKQLSDTSHIGLEEGMGKKLGMVDADATRGRLMAQMEADRSHLGVYLLACYVVDDTDFWGDGEIYWWSIPAIVDTEGKVTKNALYGLPNGAPPHKCGDHEWMTNLSLKTPPLLAVIPPEDAVDSCVVRLGIYDDDGAAANMPKAMTEGLETLASMTSDAMTGPEQIINPIREAIYKSLRADQDDILIDQDITLRKGEVTLFASGMVGSIINAMCRVYYFVKDEGKTEQFGPVTLHKGQTETVKFDSPLKSGGRLALFARGADVGCSAFGDLTTDMPFMNRVIETRHEGGLENGFHVTGQGPAKFVAFYTPA